MANKPRVEGERRKTSSFTLSKEVEDEIDRAHRKTGKPKARIVDEALAEYFGIQLPERKVKVKDNLKELARLHNKTSRMLEALKAAK